MAIFPTNGPALSDLFSGGNDLFNLGTNLMVAGGPQAQPNSFGSAVGRGILATQQQRQSKDLEALKTQLLKAQIGDIPVGRYLEAQKIAQDANKPQSPEAKLRADLNAGRITQDQFDAANNPDQYEPVQDANGNVVAQKNIKNGKIEAMPDYGGGSDKAFDQSTKLRKEYIASSGDFVKVRDAFNRIEASASDPSAAGDLALIFNYMKVLDPGSTVREGEFATAQNSGAVPDRVWNMYNRVMSGERLAPGQRDDFVNRAGKLYGAQRGSQEQLEAEYRRLAKQSNLNPTNVIVDFLPKSNKSPADMTDEELQRALNGE